MYDKWLRSFHAVAREGGFTAAARALGVSQPTVTEQVRSLEARFGVELVYRRGRRVSLSAAGMELYRITRNVLGHAEEAIRFLTSAGRGEGVRFRIGAANPYGVMPLVKAFGDGFPDAALTVSVDRHEQIIDALLDFRVDVAVIGRDVGDDRVLVMPSRRVRVDLLVPADHPWAGRASVAVAELEGQPIVQREPESTTRQAFERVLRAAGVSTRTALETDNREVMREAIALGMGIGVVAEGQLLPHEHLRAVPLADAEMTVSFRVACLADRRERPLVRAFMALAS